MDLELLVAMSLVKEEGSIVRGLLTYIVDGCSAFVNYTGEDISFVGYI